MTDQPIDPKLIAKLKKMMALAKDGSATEGEANNAAEMAQRIMMENNISMAQVDTFGGVGEEGSQRTKSGRKGNAMYVFQQKLMAACAEVNFVYQEVRYEYTRAGRRAKGYILIGREANVIATQILFDYLASTCENLGIAYVDYDNRRRMSIEALSFKEGVADRVSERLRTRHFETLREQQREANERNAAARHPANAGTALVVVMEDYAQTEADRNNDLRLNKPEGWTATRRLMASRESEIASAISDALAPHKMNSDREFLMKLMEVAVGALVANRGWDAEDEALKRVISLRYRYDMDSHVTRAQELQEWEAMTDAQRARAERKAEKEAEKYWERYQRRQNRGSGGPQRNIDYSAYRAGSDAGDRVGLDKQVDEKAKARLR